MVDCFRQAYPFISILFHMGFLEVSSTINSMNAEIPEFQYLLIGSSYSENNVGSIQSGPSTWPKKPSFLEKRLQFQLPKSNLNSGVCVCVDLLKRSKTCTWISILGSLWDLYLDGILTNLTYMKFKLQILYWFIARLRGLPLWYFIFGWHAYYFNLHEVCSFKFYSRGRRDTSLGRR